MLLFLLWDTTICTYLFMYTHSLHLSQFSLCGGLFWTTKVQKTKQISIDIFRIFLKTSKDFSSRPKSLIFLTNFLYTQVGYFVGGVASLESGQIAGIAVTFASIALVLLVFLLVFLLRHRHCSSSMVLCSSRNNKQTSANGHLQVEKANANGHVIHQTLNVSYLVCISL